MATAKYKADGNMIAQPPADTMSMPGHDGVVSEGQSTSLSRLSRYRERPC